jgi:hypothetical protein
MENLWTEKRRYVHAAMQVIEIEESRHPPETDNGKYIMRITYAGDNRSVKR